MTRARFLSLVASLPVMAQIHPAENGALKSGQPLITAGTPDEDTLLLAKSDLASSEPLAKGKGLASVLAPDKSALYTAYYGVLGNKPILTLAITQFTSSPRWGNVIYYPGSYQGRSWSLAISPNGRELYTFVEGAAYTLDTLSGNFLPKTVDGIESGNIIARNGREFDQYVPEKHLFRRYRLTTDGSLAASDEIPSPAGTPAKASDVVRCSAGPVSYFVHADGLVIIASDVYKVVRVDPAPAGSEMQTPTVSADGKLLFVPTGASYFIDRISVYETANFARVREIQSQRRLSSITASLDGSRLYATQQGGAISILDSTSLAEIKTVRYPYPAVRSILVAP